MIATITYITDQRALVTEDLSIGELNWIFSHSDAPECQSPARWCSHRWFSKAMRHLQNIISKKADLQFYEQNPKSFWDLSPEDTMIVEWWVNKCRKAQKYLRPVFK